MNGLIILDIIPAYISSSEWTDIYQESLVLIKSCSSQQSEKYFSLAKNIGDYKGKGVKEVIDDKCKDILFSLVNKNHIQRVNEYGKISTNKIYTIFNIPIEKCIKNKHILAIACLIESRFPQHAIVHGNISKDQMKKQMQEAITWANSVLEKPINITDRADNVKLLNRIKKVLKNELDTMETFMQLTLNENDINLSEFITSNFSKDTIIKYYTRKFKQGTFNSTNLNKNLITFFNQGHSLNKALDICVKNENGCKLRSKDFIKIVSSIIDFEILKYKEKE